MALNLTSMKFDNTLGALLVGGLCATALYGATCVQMYTYFMRESKDNTSFKWLIGFLWILDTFDAVLNGHLLYFYLISNYLNPLAMMNVVWSVITHVAVTSFTNFIVRGMFIYRLLLLSEKNWLLTAILMAGSTTDLVVGIVITAKAFALENFVEIKSLSTLFYVNFAAGTGSDLFLALALCFYLRRSKTGFQRTDSLIHTLMTYSLNTGLLVALDAGAGMITYIVMPDNFIFLGFYLLLSKLYLNSYLACLNAREGLRMTMDDPVSIHLSNITISSHPRRDDPNCSRPTASIASVKSKPEAMGISASTLVDQKIDDIP